MIAACIGTPISWLRLEQYLLGELPAATMREVQQHLDACAACKSCIEFAERPRSPRSNDGASELVRALRMPAPEKPTLVRFPRRLLPPRWAAIALSAAAIVGAIVLASRPALDAWIGSVPPRRASIKGGELAMGLIRERAGAETLDPASVSRKDRIRIMVTCPPDAAKRWEAVVYQAGAVDFPLQGGPIACGNRVVLPGAFRMTATGSATVCVVLDPPSRAVLGQREPRALPLPRVCERLQVEP